MGIKHAALGMYPKTDRKNKVYYVNRNNYGFSVKKIGPDGKPIQRTNMATGMPITNSRGEPEFIEETVMFKPWQIRFTELGYWCCYEVTKETPKIIADELERKANSRNHQVMTEKAFVEFSNPMLAKHMEETADLEEEKKMLAEDVEKSKKELEEAKKEKSKVDEEIARLKAKTGIK